MDDLNKVSSLTLYSLWRNMAVGLITLIAMVTLSRVLPFYAAPILSVLASATLYTMLYADRFRADGSCTLVIYALMFCTIGYTVVVVLANLLGILWDVKFPPELIFVTNPYIPTLILNPTCFVTLVIIYMRRHRLHICYECKLKKGGVYEQGLVGSIISTESRIQLKNLMIIFGALSVVVWAYYILAYLPLSVNARDWYVFTWITIIVFIFDVIYFIYRYYNLYLDLKENEQVISPEEIGDMTAKTYLRVYVICGNYLYLDPHSIVPGEQYHEVLDTPFITRRPVNGIDVSEVRELVTQMTGLKGGTLKFFFGRKSTELKEHSMLRYFYFLDGTHEDYPELSTDGEWVDFNRLKKIYSRTPGKLSGFFVADITRLATIILTEKIFDEEGRRKSRIKSYIPSFDLEDVRDSDLDFQDDKWIRVSLFNSDKPFFAIRKFFRRKERSRVGDSTWNTKL